jgi:hypothetical protein
MIKLDKEEFLSYFEFKRPDNSLMSYVGLFAEYLISPLVLIIALLSSIKIGNNKRSKK